MTVIGFVGVRTRLFEVLPRPTDLSHCVRAGNELAFRLRTFARLLYDIIVLDYAMAVLWLCYGMQECEGTSGQRCCHEEQLGESSTHL